MSNYWYPTYASVFGDDPSAAVKRLISQMTAIHQPPATGGFVTGAAAIDGVAAAIKQAHGSTKGSVLAAIMEQVQEPAHDLGQDQLLAEAAQRLRPRLPLHAGAELDAEVRPALHHEEAGQSLSAIDGRRLASEASRWPGGSLRATAVSRAFEGVHALQGVDIELHRHEVVGLIGPNGAGKTTLVNVMTGFDFPTSGSVALGRRADHLMEPSPSRTGGARPHVPAQPLVRLAVGAGERRGGGTRLRGERPRGPQPGRDLLELLGLEAYGRRPAATLAHGDERKLGVARALATAPRFVLMDEPAAGLPEAEVPDFAAVVRSVRDEYEAGVLLIDHNMALIMEVCDRIHVLDQGRTLAEGTPQEIRGNLDVTAAYLGESAVHEGAG